MKLPNFRPLKDLPAITSLDLFDLLVSNRIFPFQVKGSAFAAAGKRKSRRLHDKRVLPKESNHGALIQCKSPPLAVEIHAYLIPRCRRLLNPFIHADECTLD